MFKKRENYRGNHQRKSERNPYYSESDSPSPKMSSLDDDMFIGGDRGETLSMTLEEIDLAIAAADAPVSSPRGINTYVRSTTSPRAGSDMIGSSSSLPKHGDQSGRSSLRRLGSGEHMHRTTRNITMPPPLAPVRAASAERARKAVPVLAVRVIPSCLHTALLHCAHLSPLIFNPGECRSEGQRSSRLTS